MDAFSVWTPFDVVKSSPNGGDATPATGRIGGIISSSTRDQQGEELCQKGIDWSYFLKHGWFNYEHQQGPDNVIGHPELVAETMVKGKAATRVEGVLFMHNPVAAKIYNNAVAMQKAGGSRQLGFSVEGKVLERFGKQVMKSMVLNVAITAHPVNPDGRLEVLAKAAFAAVGYQHPATPAAGAPLSPLVPQSLDGTPAIATYGRYAMDANRMSVQELAELLVQKFPHLSFDKALYISRELARVVN